MDLSLSPEEAEFRDQVRGFLAASLPADIAHKVKHGHSIGVDDNRRWGKILYEQGWIAPNWPAEHGGPGRSPIRPPITTSSPERVWTAERAAAFVKSR